MKCIETRLASPRCDDEPGRMCHGSCTRTDTTMPASLNKNDVAVNASRWRTH